VSRYFWVVFSGIFLICSFSGYNGFELISGTLVFYEIQPEMMRIVYFFPGLFSFFVFYYLSKSDIGKAAIVAHFFFISLILFSLLAALVSTENVMHLFVQSVVFGLLYMLGVKNKFWMPKCKVG